jgi:hypothetical protein
MRTPVDDYMAAFNRSLRCRPSRRRALLIEVRDHLEEAAAELEADGIGRPDAEAIAVSRFGAVRAAAVSLSGRDYLPWSLLSWYFFVASVVGLAMVILGMTWLVAPRLDLLTHGVLDASAGSSVANTFSREHPCAVTGGVCVTRTLPPRMVEDFLVGSGTIAAAAVLASHLVVRRRLTPGVAFGEAQIALITWVPAAGAVLTVAWGMWAYLFFGDLQAAAHWVSLATLLAATTAGTLARRHGLLASA